MKIVDIKDRPAGLVDELVEIWQGSVEATHLFLGSHEIGKIRKYVPEALKAVPVLVIAFDEEGRPLGFMGIAGKKLEMLFIAAHERGRGIGKALLQYGMDVYSVNDLAVNEQNPKARGFYEKMGFHVYRRTERDEQGGPYPLLYMKRD